MSASRRLALLLIAALSLVSPAALHAWAHAEGAHGPAPVFGGGLEIHAQGCEHQPHTDAAPHDTSCRTCEIARAHVAEPVALVARTTIDRPAVHDDTLDVETLPVSLVCGTALPRGPPSVA